MQEGDYKVPSENSSEFEGSVALNCRPCEEKLFEKLLQTLKSTLDSTPLFSYNSHQSSILLFSLLVMIVW